MDGAVGIQAAANLCAMGLSTFDTTILFKNLQVFIECL